MAAHFEAATLRVEIVEARGLRQAGRGNRSQLEIQRSYAQVYIEGLGPAYQRRTRHWRTKNNFNSDDPRWNQAFSVNIDGKQFAGEVYDGALRFLVLVARKNASVDEELVGTVRLPLGVLLQYLLSDESRSSHRSNTQRSGEPVFDRWYQMSLDFDNKNLLEGASGHAPTIHIKISLLGRGDTAGSKNGSVTSNKNSKVTKEQNRGDQRKQLRQLSLASSTKAAPNGGMERRKVPNRSPDDDVITPAVLGGNDFARSLVAVFERADSDRDGFVSVDDLRRVVARHPRLLAALNLPHPDTFTRVLEFLSGAAQSNDFSRNGNHKLDSPEHRGQRVPVTRATTNKNDNRQRRRLTIDDIHTVLVEQLRHPSVRKLITQAAESRIPSSNGADAKGVRTKALGFVFDVLVRQQRSAAPHPAVADDARLLATKSVLVLGHFAGEEWSHEELRGAMRQAGVRYTSLAAQAATSGGPTHGYLQHLTRSDFVAVCLVLLAGATKHTFDACVGGYLDFIEATTARRQLLTGVFETIVEPLSDDPHFSRIPPSGLAAQASHKDKRRASYSVSSPKPRQALPPAPPKKAALEQWCWCLNSGIATTRAAPRNAEISEEDRHLFLAGLATAQTMRTARAVFCGWSCRRVNTLSDAQLHSVVARYLDVHEAYAKRHQRKPDIALDHHSPSGAKGFAAQQQRQILAAAYRAVQGSPLSGEKDEDLTDKVGTTEIVHRRIARGISAPDLIEFGHYLGQAWNEVDCFRALNLSTIDVEDEDEAIPMISENAFLDFCICKLQAQDEMNGSKGSANGMQTASLLERIKRFLSVKGCSASRLRVLEDCLQVLQASGTTPPIAVSGRDMARPVAQTTAIFVSKEVWTFALIVRAGLSIAGLQKLQPLEEKGGDVLGPFVANGIRELLALSNDQQQASSPAVLRGLWLSIAAHLSENVTESELVKRLKNFATVISHQKTLPSSRRLALRLLNKDILFLAETIPQNGHSEITQVELPRYNFREDDTTSAARSSQLSPSREIYSRTEASFRLSHLNSIRGGVDGLVESYLATARAKARAKEKIGAVEASAASIAERNGSGAPDGNRRSPVKNNKAGMVGGESPSVQHLQVNELSSNRTVNGRRPWNEGYIRPHIESLVGPSTYGRRVGGTRKPSMVQHYACVALQAAARGVVSKNRFMRERKSARSIQMWWRRHFHGRCATVADEVRKLQLMSSEVVRGVRRLVQTSQLRISGDVVGASTIAALERAGLESANQLDVVAKQLMQLGGKPRQNNHGAYDDQGGVQMSATKGKKKAPRRQHHQQHKFAQEEPSPQLSTFQQRRQQLSKQNQKDDELTPRSTRSLQEVPPATIRPPTVSKLSSDRNQLAAVASTLSTSTRPRTTSTARSRVSFRALSGKGEALIFDETLTGSPSGASYPSGTDGEGEDGDEGETLWAESGGDKRLRSPPEECTQKIEKRSQIAAVEDTPTNDAAVLLAKAQERIAEVQKKNLELQSYKEKASMHLKAQHAVIQKLAKMGIGLRK